MQETFGSLLWSSRISEQMTMKELSLETGLSISYISRLERNLRTPSVDTVKRLAKVLPLSVYAMLQAANHEESDPAYIELADLLTKDVVLHGQKPPAALIHAIQSEIRRHQKGPNA